MKMTFFALWGLSLLLLLAAAAQLWRAFVRKKKEVTRALAKSLGLLFVSIFCVRAGGGAVSGRRRTCGGAQWAEPV